MTQAPRIADAQALIERLQGVKVTARYDEAGTLWPQLGNPCGEAVAELARLLDERDAAHAGAATAWESANEAHGKAARLLDDNERLRERVAALEHSLVRHNCGTKGCLCRECCDNEDARAALTGDSQNALPK